MKKRKSITDDAWFDAEEKISNIYFCLNFEKNLQH